MAVNTTEISTVYDALIAKHITRLDTLFADNKINSDMYAKIFASLMQPTMQLATSTVQQQPVLDAQVLKTNADTAFVIEQDTQLEASVTYNNKIKALDSYGDMIGTMGAGSLVISDEMWTQFFNMIAGLNTDASDPVTYTVTKK